jgi:hypothetical protein
MSAEVVLRCVHRPGNRRARCSLPPRQWSDLLVFVDPDTRAAGVRPSAGRRQKVVRVEGKQTTKGELPNKDDVWMAFVRAGTVAMPACRPASECSGASGSRACCPGRRLRRERRAR